MNNHRILVVSVHPDDETLGCGGTIFKSVDKGDSVYWLIITNANIEDGFPLNMVEQRKDEIDKVANLYGFVEYFSLNFPTCKLDIIPKKELIDKISNVITQVKPDIIYLPNRNDIHSDHKIAFDAVYSCTKNFRFPFIKKVLMYETLSETEFAPPTGESAFIPNTFCDISEYLAKKNDIMIIFEWEIMSEFLPRSINSITALARYRGSRIGVKYAEAFQLLLDVC